MMDIFFLQVVELIGKEDIKLSKKQLNELIDVIEKEEVLEVEYQIQEALKKESMELDGQNTQEIIDTGKNVPNSIRLDHSGRFEESLSKKDLKFRTDSSRNYLQSSLMEKNNCNNSKISKTSESVHKNAIPSNVSTSKKAEGSKQL